MLGGQIVAELNGAGSVTRGFVYLGGQLLAVQQSNQVSWVHQDPVVKSKRVTDSAGIVISTVELDPWGGDTNRNNNEGFQPRRFTTYDRDGNKSDEAMHRRYNRWHSRFDQPDPYGGSYDPTDPQSFNRYSYVQNDPVNFVDPSGLTPQDPLKPPTTPAIDPETGQPHPGGVPGPVENVDVNIGRASGSNNGGFVGVFGSGDTGITTVDPPINEGGLVGSGPQNPTLIPLPSPPPIELPPIFGISFEDYFRCGVNPVTGEHGYSDNPRGVPGHLRPGVGGQGHFHAPRRGDPQGHQGLDVSGINGVSPVYANRDGRVTFAGPTGGMAGNLVIVDHGGGVSTRYAHLSGFTAGLARGSIVSEGQQIGTVGQTGNARNLPAAEAHVHFGVQINGQNRNPANYLNNGCP